MYVFTYQELASRMMSSMDGKRLLSNVSSWKNLLTVTFGVNLKNSSLVLMYIRLHLFEKYVSITYLVPF